MMVPTLFLTVHMLGTTESQQLLEQDCGELWDGEESQGAIFMALRQPFMLH